MAQIRTRHLEQEMFARAAAKLISMDYRIIGPSNEDLTSENAGGHIVFGICDKNAGNRAKIWRDNVTLGADKVHWVIEVAGLELKDFALNIAKALNEVVEIGKYLETIDVLII